MIHKENICPPNAINNERLEKNMEIWYTNEMGVGF